MSSRVALRASCACRYVTIWEFFHCGRSASLIPSPSFSCFRQDTHSLHTHYDPAKVPAGDVFIHAGDFTNMGSIDDIKSFNAWLGNLAGFKYKIVIAGNRTYVYGRSVRVFALVGLTVLSLSLFMRW